MLSMIKELQGFDRKMIQRHLVPAGVALGIGLCLTLPSYFGVVSTAARLKGIQDSTVAALRNVALLPAFEEEQARLEKEINQTRQALFTDDEVGDFIADISEVARNFEVQITSSRPNRLADYIKPEFQKSYEAFEFEIDLESGFDGLVKLLATLYQKPKIFKIQELSVTGRENQTDTNKVSLSLTVISAKGTAKNAGAK